VALTPVAQIVSVGVAGGAADEQVATVAAALAAAGLPAASRVFVEDDEAALERALRADVSLTVVLADPGGSTSETVRRAVAGIADVGLDDRLALPPRGAALWRVADAAPAWALEAGSRAFVVLPRAGSLERTLEAHLGPFVRARLAGRGLAFRTLRVVGVSLSAVDERLADWRGPAAAAGEVEVSAVTAEGEVWVRLRARGATPAAAAETLASVEAKISALLGDDCYSRDEEALERVVGRLLAARRLTLAVAESCTGGLLGHRLTNVPGSSNYFECGVVVYSNRAKEEMLGVPASVLRAHGAVSGPCSEAMATGICRASGSDCGLAITGIAGPDGGTPAKPVGTVFIGLAVRGAVTSRRFQFAGDRGSVKWQSAQMALDMLRRRLLSDGPAGAETQRPVLDASR
jgi:nicotinamide-nucleotide amidase